MAGFVGDAASTGMSTAAVPVFERKQGMTQTIAAIGLWMDDCGSNRRSDRCARWIHEPMREIDEISIVSVRLLAQKIVKVFKKTYICHILPP